MSTSNSILNTSPADDDRTPSMDPANLSCREDVMFQLPLSLRRVLALVQELDDDIQTQQSLLPITLRSYCEARHDSELADQRVADANIIGGSTGGMLSQVARICSQILHSSEEKSSLALTVYNLVDRHVRLVENAIKEQEAVLLSQGHNLEIFSNFANEQQNGETPDYQLSAGLSAVTRSGKRSTSSSRQMREQPLQEAPRTIISVGVADGDLPVNPHEPRYCYCNGVSYGTMIACDSGICETEWFHLSCAGLTEVPEDKKWYCTYCKEKMQQNTSNQKRKE